MVAQMLGSLLPVSALAFLLGLPRQGYDAATLYLLARQLGGA